MITPEFTSAYEITRKEGTFRAILHLLLSGYVPTEEEEAIIAAIPVNRGGMPRKETQENHDRLARYLLTIKAVWNLLGRGDQFRRRAIDITRPEFPEFAADEELEFRLTKGKRWDINLHAKAMIEADPSLVDKIALAAKNLIDATKVLSGATRGRNRT